MIFRMKVVRFLPGLIIFLTVLGLGLSQSAYAKTHVLASGIYGYGPNAISLSKHYDKRFCKIAKSIQLHTDIRLSCHSYSNQKRYMRDILNNKIDLAYVSPFLAYNLMQRNPNLRSLVTVKEVDIITGTDSPYYGGIIIVRKNSPFHNLMQLKNIKFGFSFHGSTSGYILPTLLFSKQLKNQNDQLLSFSQNLQQAKALMSGKVSAIAIWSGMLKKKILKDKVRILGSYQGVPNHQILINTKLFSQKEQEKLLSEFISMKDHVTHYAGFTPSSSSISQAGRDIFKNYCHMNPKECRL